MDRTTIRWWIKRHGLPYKKRITRKSKSFYLIDSSGFWKWAERHKDKVQFSNIDSQVLLPEPDWIEEERLKDQHIVKKRKYQYWTTKEDLRLLELRKKGLTYAGIGERMNRSLLVLNVDIKE